MLQSPFVPLTIPLPVRILLCLVVLLVGGPARGETAGPPNLTVTHHALRMKIGFERSGWYMHKNQLSATSVISIKNAAGEPASRIPIVLNRLLEALSVRSGDGNALPFRQEIRGLEGWRQKQVNFVSAALPAPLEPGEEMVLQLEYSGSLAPYTDVQQIFVQERLDPDFTMIRSESYGYPHVERPAVRTEMPEPFHQRLEFNLPAGTTAASGHRLVEARDEGDGTVTWVYESDEPMMQIVVPIAKYEVLEGDGYRVYAFPEDRKGAARVSDGLKESMRLMERWFGPMGREAWFCVAEIPEGYGSQALMPTIIQEASAFEDPARMYELYHEVSHFWDVPMTEDPSPRWNEGLATFMEALVMERLGNPGYLGRDMDANLRAFAKNLEKYPEWQEIPIRELGTRGVSGLMSYRAGGLFFAILWNLVGEETFTRVMSEYRSLHLATGADTETFVHHWVMRTGARTRRLFRDWFDTNAYVEKVLSAPDFASLSGLYTDGS